MKLQRILLQFEVYSTFETFKASFEPLSQPYLRQHKTRCNTFWHNSTAATGQHSGILVFYTQPSRYNTIAMVYNHVVVGLARVHISLV